MDTRGEKHPFQYYLVTTGAGMNLVTCPLPATEELWALRKEHLTVCVPVLEILGSGGLSLITKPEEEKN